ncbi:MAG TPA: TerB family tellurite resistance protein [Deltaproteobacteria bacterium]|nr:TerB family tellurite resistance protein [Deltaproteobacteria bacterium]
MSTPPEEIERLAALALAPLVEVAWADGRVTPAERAAVLEAAKDLEFNQFSDFSRSTLRRWLAKEPPTEALQRWRKLLACALAESDSRIARLSEERLLEEARRIAKMDVRPFEPDTSIDPRAGITEEEQRVLDDLAAALESVDRGDD